MQTLNSKQPDPASPVLLCRAYRLILAWPIEKPESPDPFRDSSLNDDYLKDPKKGESNES